MTKTMMLAAMTMVGKYFWPLLVSWSSGAALRRKTCGIPFYPIPPLPPHGIVITMKTMRMMMGMKVIMTIKTFGVSQTSPPPQKEKNSLRYISAAFPAFLGLLAV